MATHVERDGYDTISEIRQANEDAGLHFFEPATMRFFNSKIASRAVFGRHVFVTSEQFVGSDHVAQPRRYTLRSCYDGKVNTVGDFQQYRTIEEAKAAAKALAKFQRVLP